MSRISRRISVGRLFSGLCLACALAATAARALPAETYLLVIGNNDGSGGDQNLLYAERDAEELAEVLRQTGPIASTRIQMLLDERADTVRRALLELNATLRARAQTGAPTALVVFYSGHGDATSLHLNGTELALDELKALVAGSPAGVRLLIVDACRSGSVTRVKGVQAAPSFQIGLEDEVATSGLAILTSSGAGENSQESDKLRGSFFTHHLMNALRGAADQDGDGKVTLSEAYNYAYAQTLRASGQTVALQHPTYSWDLKGRGDLVLSQPAELRGRIGKIRFSQPALYLVLEGSPSGAIKAEVAAPASHRELSIAAGDYYVEQRLPSEYREYHVDLEAGATAELDHIPFQRIQYDHLVRARGSDHAYSQGLSVLAAGRGEIVPGEGATPQALIGYAIDFPSLSVGARLRASTVSTGGPDDLLPRRHSELGLGVVLSRFVDFDWFSLGFGLSVEGVWHHQSFSGARDAPSRDIPGADFAGLITLERHLFGGTALHLEGGPMTSVFRAAQSNDGTQISTQLATPLTYWFAGGLVWRL